MEKRIIQVEEKVPVKLLIPLSIQHMFAMFGASVLVPFLFGISPAIVLFMNGIGTLLFIAITKGKAPAYLGSSFAFLAPAKKDGFETFLLLVIQMKGIRKFYPNDETHKAFGDALRAAAAAGVHILAYDCIVTENSMDMDEKVEVGLLYDNDTRTHCEL